MIDVWLDSVVLLRTGSSMCAGVLIEGRPGVVATAYHCVASGMRPLVVFHDRSEAKGEVIARDPAHDLALVRVETERPGLPLREGSPSVGERVYGMGHPYGTVAAGKLEGLLEWSVAEGIVSAVGTWLIQTDTPLNPGNSGGPLVDEQGRVVGIVSRKIDAEGLTFAARADDVAKLAGAPDMGSWVGGTWGLGVGLFSGPDTVPAGTAFVAVRERIVARAWLGVGVSRAAPEASVELDLRQRVGRGNMSTTFDVGGGVRAGETGVAPIVTGRVGVAGVGFSGRWQPTDGAFWAGVDLEWPGVVGVF
ncbi:MAG: S1C family serine protease [Myxococcota bacterium]